MLRVTKSIAMCGAVSVVAVGVALALDGCARAEP
jgi:hypothetical protein